MLSDVPSWFSYEPANLHLIMIVGITTEQNAFKFFEIFLVVCIEFNIWYNKHQFVINNT